MTVSETILDMVLDLYPSYSDWLKFGVAKIWGMSGSNLDNQDPLAALVTYFAVLSL